MATAIRNQQQQQQQQTLEKKKRNMVTRIRIASRFSLWPLDVLIDLLL